MNEAKAFFDALVQELGEVSKRELLHDRIMGMAKVRNKWTAQVRHTYGNGDKAIQRLRLDFCALCVHAAHSQAEFEQALSRFNQPPNQQE